VVWTVVRGAITPVGSLEAQLLRLQRGVLRCDCSTEGRPTIQGASALSSSSSAPEHAAYLRGRKEALLELIVPDLPSEHSQGLRR
jgi:hypothetical protein